VRPPRPNPSRRLALGMALALAFAVGHAGGPPLTYAAALELAAAAPSVRLAERAFELAQRQLEVAAAPIRGELGAGYRWTRGERDLGDAGRVDLAAEGWDALTLSLAFPTVGYGPAADAVARARGDLARVEAELGAARRTARLEVTQGFQRALRAREAAALAAADLDLAELELEAAAWRRAAGAASDADRARAALAVERARAAAAAAEREVEAAERLLAVVLGVPTGPPAGPLPDPAAWLAVVGAAWERRPDVLSARLQVAETDRAADGALRDNLPSASLSVAGTFADPDRTLLVSGGLDTRTLQPSVAVSYDPDTGATGLPDDGRLRTFTVAVAVRIPLNPALGDALAAGRLGRERAAAQLELTLARAGVDVEQRRLDAETALANADLARAGADLAAADLELARLRFAGGHLAELALRRAEVEHERARLDAARAADAARLAALRLLDALAVEPADLE
jgi:outer membrane protein TolC